jgi:hypothetical protein
MEEVRIRELKTDCKLLIIREICLISTINYAETRVVNQCRIVK